MTKDFEKELGEDYDLFNKVCPYHETTEKLVGETLASMLPKKKRLEIVEIGCGTGLTTREILKARSNFAVLALDEAETMTRQTRQNLNSYVSERRLTVLHTEAHDYLASRPTNSIDAIASAYAIHNIPEQKRQLLFDEVRRTLKPGGVFINNDKIAHNNVKTHLKELNWELSLLSQLEDLGRKDLKDMWHEHYMRDNQEGYIMREGDYSKALYKSGFREIKKVMRLHMDAIYTGVK